MKLDPPDHFRLKNFWSFPLEYLLANTQYRWPVAYTIYLAHFSPKRLQIHVKKEQVGG